MIAQRAYTSTSLQRPITSALVAITCAFTLAWCLDATARDMSGKGGIGVMTTLMGAPNFVFRYWAGSVATELHVGGDIRQPEGQPRLTRVRAGVGVHYRLLDTQRVSASLGARGLFGLIYQDRSSVGGAIEAPLQVEYFLSDNLSFQAGVGLVADVSGERGNPLTAQVSGIVGRGETGVDTGISLKLTGGYSGGLGLTYYF